MVDGHTREIAVFDDDNQLYTVIEGNHRQSTIDRFVVMPV